MTHMFTLIMTIGVLKRFNLSLSITPSDTAHLNNMAIKSSWLCCRMQLQPYHRQVGNMLSYRVTSSYTVVRPLPDCKDQQSPET